jgi:centromere protein I
MYLRRWNGRENRSEILNLLQFLPRGPYDDLRRDYLEPLENAVLDHTASSRSALLDFYALLIRQWGVAMRAEGPSFSADGFTPLISLITHAELLSLSLLEIPLTAADLSSKASKPVATTILELYNTLANLYSHAANNGNIRLTVPLAPTVYSLAFTSNLALISLLCSVLATYKSSFEESLVSQTFQSPVKSAGAFYATEMVALFNGYIMDICNLVWRNRGLNADDPNALGCLIPAPTKTALNEYINDSNEMLKRRKGSEGPTFHYSLQMMFSLSHHVALADLSAACFADFEDQKVPDAEGQARLRKPVTQKNLTALEKDGGVKINWQDYRVKMLDWFDERGSEGIGRLMRSTMTALRKKT